VIVHVPDETNVRSPLELTEHSAGVDDVNDTASPDDAVAVSVGVVPNTCVPGLVNVIACAAFGVTGAEATDDELVPAVFVALTVNV
jgi:hypothetical protein